MKRLVAHVIFIALVAYPFVCFSAFVIHLKNGQAFQTDSYWEDGGEIKFHRYGGVVGIKKDLVREIEEVVDLPEDKKAVKDKPIQPAEAAKKKVKPPEKADDVEKAEVPEAAEKTDNDLVDIEYYKREKQRLEQELDEAKRRYLSSLENGNKETKHAASRNALKINIQIDQLKKELKEKNKGILPKWWNE